MDISVCQSCHYYGAKSNYCFKYFNGVERVDCCDAKKSAYDNLCEDVLNALGKMYKYCARPQFIYLSPEAFNTIVKEAPQKPTFFGLEVRVDNLSNGAQFMIVEKEMTE